MQQCGWAKAKSGRLVLTGRGQAVLVSWDPSEFAAGVKAFLLNNDFDELNRINHIRGQSGGGKRYLTPPGERRDKISAAIGQWPVNKWVALKSERLWELDAGRILTHLESGGKVEDALQFLENNCATPVPETVQTMLSDLARRGTVVQGVEEALLIELVDETTAALIAHDSQAGKFCWLAGGRRLAVPRRNSRAFRSAIKKLGFIIPDGQFPS